VSGTRLGSLPLPSRWPAYQLSVQAETDLDLGELPSQMPPQGGGKYVSDDNLVCLAEVVIGKQSAASNAPQDPGPHRPVEGQESAIVQMVCGRAGSATSPRDRLGRAVQPAPNRRRRPASACVNNPLQHTQWHVRDAVEKEPLRTEQPVLLLGRREADDIDPVVELARRLWVTHDQRHASTVRQDVVHILCRDGEASLGQRKEHHMHGAAW
jgi:hypothetical protein